MNKTNDDRTININWREDEENVDRWSTRPPSYATAPSLYEYDSGNSSSTHQPIAGSPLRYAPTTHYLEDQFRRPRDQQVSGQPQPIDTLHVLNWTGEELQPPASSRPPEYNQSSPYYILGEKTEALVASHHISGHLHLLQAFSQLRKTVENLDDAQQPVTPFPAEKDRRWAWLVAFAVDRFSQWCKSLTSEDIHCSIQEIIPPLDVLMAWHSYLLNPARYAEDCERIPWLRILSKIGQLRLVPALAGELGIILDAPVTDIRREVWSLKTGGRAFDILQDARQTLNKTLSCPDCETTIQHPYMDADGTGYLQHKFRAYCTNLSCSFIENPFDKSTLGARRLADDIVRPGSTTQSFLAGTLWPTQSETIRPQAARIKTLVAEHEAFRRPKALDDEEFILKILRRYVKTEVLQANDLIQPLNLRKTGWAWDILTRHNFSLLRIVDAIGTTQGNSEPVRTSQKIYQAYVNGDIFSLDLIGAVLRQSSFVRKMNEIGWSHPSFLSLADNERVLQHSVARYHAFLDLVAVSAFSDHKVLVPTLDIDLAWHTHQLFGTVYHEHCKRYLRFYLDHDDKIDENHLAKAFGDTSRLWKTRFKLPYTFCGCPQPGKQMFGSEVTTTHHYQKKKDLLTPRSADDLVFQMATHPSDHNAIYDNRRRSTVEMYRKNRLEKWSKREGREEGLLKGWTGTKGKSAKLENHEPAFFAHVPEWYFQGMERADCVMYAAHMLDPVYFDPGKHPVSMLRYTDMSSYTMGPDGSLRRD